MNEQDQMSVFVLAKLRVVEVALGALLARTEYHESAKALAIKVLEIYKNKALFEPMSDEEGAIAERGYHETFRAIFGEEPPK